MKDELEFIINIDNDGKYKLGSVYIAVDGVIKKEIKSRKVNLFNYATNFAFQNNIKFTKIDVDSGDYIVIFEKANLIVNEFQNYMTYFTKIKKNDKNIKNIVSKGSLFGLAGAFVIGGSNTISDGNSKYDLNNPNIIEETETVEENKSYIDRDVSSGITHIINDNINMSNIIFDFYSDDVNSNIIIYDYDDRSNSECVDKARRHMEIFERFGEMYGIDPNLLMAIMAQESGGVHVTHSQNGSAIGGMQIENFWYDKELTAYNFSTNSYENVTVEENKLDDLYYNVKIASMILRTCLNDFNYDIRKAVQAYNFGYKNMSSLGNDWTVNRKNLDVGDAKYFEHVFSFLPDGYSLTIKKDDGSSIDVILDNIHSNDYKTNFSK